MTPVKNYAEPDELRAGFAPSKRQRYDAFSRKISTKAEACLYAVIPNRDITTGGARGNAALRE